MPDYMDPRSRKEVFLKGVLDGDPPDLDANDRIELYLKQIAENSAGGGAGAGIFTFELNGLFEGTTIIGPLENYTDTTYDEIIAAITAGKIVRAYINNTSITYPSMYLTYQAKNYWFSGIGMNFYSIAAFANFAMIQISLIDGNPFLNFQGFKTLNFS